MRPAALALAAAAALYVIGAAAWLAWPVALPGWPPALGAAGAGLAALLAAISPQGQPPARPYRRAALLGLAAGGLAPALGAAFMVLKTAVHAQPQFTQAALIGLLARAPVWAVAGCGAGLGLALLRQALGRGPDTS